MQVIAYSPSSSKHSAHDTSLITDPIVVYLASTYHVPALCQHIHHKKSYTTVSYNLDYFLYQVAKKVVPGIEPGLSESKSEGITITPYDLGVSRIRKFRKLEIIKLVV